MLLFLYYCSRTSTTQMMQICHYITPTNAYSYQFTHFQVSIVIYSSKLLLEIFKYSLILSTYAINSFIFVHCAASHSLQQHIINYNLTNTIRSILQSDQVSFKYILKLMFSFFLPIFQHYYYSDKQNYQSVYM